MKIKNEKLPVVFLLCFSALLAACSNKSASKEIKGNGLTIQIRKLADEPDDKVTSNYAARLIPDQKIILENTIATKMLYNMDSTFYIQQGKQKIYADLIQPVANGVKGSFEYLVSFNGRYPGKKKCALIYQDKYLTHKKYNISPDNE